MNVNLTRSKNFSSAAKLRMPLSSTAVSYTHLDVYKRQPTQNTKQTTDKDRKQQIHNTNIHQQTNRKNCPQIQKSRIQNRLQNY